MILILLKGSKIARHLSVIVRKPISIHMQTDGWIDGWLAILRPFQKYFCHIKTIGGWWCKAVCNGTPFKAEKNLPRMGIELCKQKSEWKYMHTRKDDCFLWWFTELCMHWMTFLQNLDKDNVFPSYSTVCWFNGPLRQYFNLYRAMSQREGERGKKG